jgi:hypothetical protein
LRLHIGEESYAAKNISQSKPAGTWVKLTVIDYASIENFPEEITGVLSVRSDNGFELCTIDTSKYARHTFVGGVLTFTNEPEPVVVEPVVYTPTVEEVRANKISEMSSACNSTIVAGIDVNGEHFALTVEDQINLLTLLYMADSGLETIPYHRDDGSCEYYTAEQFKTIAEAATNYKLYHESYFNSLKDYIKSLEDIETIQSIYYGIEIPEEYQSVVLKDLIAAMPVTEEPETVDSSEEETDIEDAGEEETDGSDEDATEETEEPAEDNAEE